MTYTSPSKAGFGWIGQALILTAACRFALLPTTIPKVKRMIDMLTERGLRHTVKVMVGGAPVNEKFANDIGADGYGADAGEAVELAKSLMKYYPHLK